LLAQNSSPLGSRCRRQLCSLFLYVLLSIFHPLTKITDSAALH
jgi:hypothetical protein